MKGALADEEPGLVQIEAPKSPLPFVRLYPAGQETGAIQ